MLNKELKKLKGSLLGIGLDNNMQELIEKNTDIIECYLLDSNNKGSNNYKGYNKTINIHKLKKYFHRKNFNYIICNFEQVKPYLRSFIKNSIYLNKDKIYFYNINDFELEELEKRYIRYNATFKIDKDYIIVDNSISKTNIIKNICFYLRDLIYDIIDYIGKMLVN